MSLMDPDAPEDPIHISKPLRWWQLELWERHAMDRLAEAKMRHPSGEMHVIAVSQNYILTQTRKRLGPGGRSEASTQGRFNNQRP